MKYRIRNWANYNQSLIKRGSLTLWFDASLAKQWHGNAKTNGRGRPCHYSDLAIITALTLRAVFHLALRATQGMVTSIIRLLRLSINCPNYTTLCRRQQQLTITLPRTLKHDEKINVLFDSTGLKVYGEGEWQVRQHGYSKRRTWRKLTLLVDADNQEIMQATLSTNDYHDKTLLPELMADVNENLGNACGDGGYDCAANYELLAKMGAKPLIPPRRDARIKGKTVRDKIIKQINKQGLKRWKVTTGYHRRSLVETAMFRIKQLFGNQLASRLFDHQATEAFIRCRALNMMTKLGMPSYSIN